MKKLIPVLFLALPYVLSANEDEKNALLQDCFDGRLHIGSVVQLQDGREGIVMSSEAVEKLRRLNSRALGLQSVARLSQRERKANQADLEKRNKTNKKIATASYMTALLAPAVLNLLNIALETSWLPFAGLGLMLVGFLVAYYAEKAARENEEVERSRQNIYDEDLERDIEALPATQR